MKKYMNFPIFYIGFIACLILLSGCLQKMSNQALGVPADDIEGALLYEFNKTKNPATGKIPEGIFDAERSQANEIVRLQRLNQRELLGSYNFVGPNNLGGRTRTITYDTRYNGTTNRIILAGGVSGGVFKSIDDGATWVRKSPTGDYFGCTSIAQDTRVGFQDTWYYTVGENLGNSSSASGAFNLGNGVYKSTDNGETWARLPASNTGALENFDHVADLISKVVVDPTNGNVYIAALATIIRSVDGGTNWSAVLSGSASTSSQLTDIAVTSTGRLYAAFAGANSVGADGVWTSTTGASGSWTRIAQPGTPAGWNANAAYGRVVLSIAPSAQNLVYALYWNNVNSTCATPSPEAELYRWDQTGSTWTDLSANLPDEAGCSEGNDPFAVQTGYDLVVSVKPDDPTTVYIGGTNIYRSTNSGTSWTRIGGYANTSGYATYANSHPDIHTIVFQPTNAAIMLCGNDGGIQRTTNNLAATVVWNQINLGYRTYQYYYVGLDPRVANDKVLGGAQDNGSTRNVGGTGSTFERVWSGDGVSVGLSNLVSSNQYEYVGSQVGSIARRNATQSADFGTTITPTGQAGLGLFVTLFRLDDDNTENLYYANQNRLYRTTSASTVTSSTWTTMTGIGTTVGGANSITAIATTRGSYNASTANLFLGTSNGKIYRLDDPANSPASNAPMNISGAGFPAGAYMSSIAVNPRNDDTVLVTFSNYGVVSVFWTGNANTASPTWTAVEGALTLPSYRSSAIVVTPAGVQYFVGTSQGLYHSAGLPGAVAWAQEGPSLMGNALINDLKLRPSDNKLLVGTHGYGMWYSNFNPVTSSTDYFRSIASGNWNAPATWESSPVSDFSAGVISPATLTPDVNSNNIHIRNGHTVTVTANVTTDQTFVNPGATLAVNGSTLTVSSNGLTVQSNATGTGRIGNSTGTISGNVNVERYIAHAGHRAWHLLSGKTVTGTQTIYQAWQENGATGAVLPNYGTWITSNLFSVVNGFDDLSLSSSILTHNQAGPNWIYTLPNTNATVLSANQGYMLFVRGDRNHTATLPTPIATSATTLRTNGSLNQGVQAAVSIASTGTGRTLVGNPYASPIDFESIQATTNLNQTFYVWDATLTGNFGVGGFVLVDRNGGTYQTTPVVLGGTTNNPNSRFIHSGQAFFLRATGGTANVIFTEASKASLVSAINPIINGPGEQQLIVNLMIANPGGDKSLADGIRVKFDNSYLTATSDDDEKIGNFAENLSSYRNNKKLIVERRPMIVKNDTIFLNMSNTGIKDYRLQLGALDFVQTGIPAKLEDTYLGTSTVINLNGAITNYDFSVTADAGSAAANRFMIVFGKAPVIMPGITKPGINIFPNPVVGRTIGMQFNDAAAGVYQLRLINNAGQVVVTRRINHSGAAAFYNVDMEKYVSPGSYHLEILKPDNSRTTRALVIRKQ